MIVRIGDSIPESEREKVYEAVRSLYRDNASSLGNVDIASVIKVASGYSVLFGKSRVGAEFVGVALFSLSSEDVESLSPSSLNGDSVGPIYTDRGTDDQSSKE